RTLSQHRPLFVQAPWLSLALSSRHRPLLSTWYLVLSTKRFGMAASESSWPRISVVVPSFNQGRFLTDALESIFRQDYPNLEVIVMDGGSTDESVSIIR